MPHQGSGNVGGFLGMDRKISSTNYFHIMLPIRFVSLQHFSGTNLTLLHRHRRVGNGPEEQHQLADSDGSPLQCHHGLARLHSPNTRRPIGQQPHH
jgi:hypothetical protein